MLYATFRMPCHFIFNSWYCVAACTVETRKHEEPVFIFIKLITSRFKRRNKKKKKELPRLTPLEYPINFLSQRAFNYNSRNAFNRFSNIKILICLETEGGESRQELSIRCLYFIQQSHARRATLRLINFSSFMKLNKRLLVEINGADSERS